MEKTKIENIKKRECVREKGENRRKKMEKIEDTQTGRLTEY